MKKTVVYLIAIFFVFQSSLLSYSSNPKDFINELVNDAISKLADKSISKDEKALFIEKIALDTFISNDTYNQHSNLIIIGGTPRGDTSTEYFKKQILDQFSPDSINTITDKELSRAKARIKANNVFKFDSVFYQAMQVGMLETKNISWKELDRYNSITNSITLGEVKAAGKKFISDQSPLVTILNPKK